MKENGYKTVGEMFSKHDKFTHHKRNKDGSYTSVVTRSLLLKEIKQYSILKGYWVMYSQTPN